MQRSRDQALKMGSSGRDPRTHSGHRTTSDTDRHRTRPRPAPLQPSAVNFPSCEPSHKVSRRFKTSTLPFPTLAPPVETEPSAKPEPHFTLPTLSSESRRLRRAGMSELSAPSTSKRGFSLPRWPDILRPRSSCVRSNRSAVPAPRPPPSPTSSFTSFASTSTAVSTHTFTSASRPPPSKPAICRSPSLATKASTIKSVTFAAQPKVVYYDNDWKDVDEHEEEEMDDIAYDLPYIPLERPQEPTPVLEKQGRLGVLARRLIPRSVSRTTSSTSSSPKSEGGRPDISGPYRLSASYSYSYSSVKTLDDSCESGHNRIRRAIGRATCMA